MTPLPRLHWSTLGEPTQGLEHRWAGAWEVTLDRGAGARPAAPGDGSLGDQRRGRRTRPGPGAGLRGGGGAAHPAAARPRRPPRSAPGPWPAGALLGSVRWGLAAGTPPLPGLRPAAAAPGAACPSPRPWPWAWWASAPAMQEVLAKARAAAATRATVLLLGESGTGKEVIAQAIHRMSAQRDQPFVPVHCGAIPDNLIESELFGYTKGAFTDARKDAPGKFREAHGGTIFLDEVSTMPLSVQVRLLRVLQEREVQPLGGGAPVKVEVRVIAATNLDLWQRVQAGSVPGGPVLPPGGGAHHPAAPARSAGRRSPSWPSISSTARPGSTDSTPRPCTPPWTPCSWPCPGAATSASWRTPSSGPSSCPADRPVLTREDFTFLRSGCRTARRSWTPCRPCRTSRPSTPRPPPPSPWNCPPRAWT